MHSEDAFEFALSCQRLLPHPHCIERAVIFRANGWHANVSTPIT